MEFYKFDRYYINKGIVLKDGYIYDARINVNIELESSSYRIAKYIFHYNKISDIIDNHHIKMDELKDLLYLLYSNDILSLKRFLSKRSIYTNNIFNLIIKSGILFYARASISIILLPLVFDISFLVSFIYCSIFILTILFHELGHLSTYYILSDYKYNVYINIDKMKFEIITALDNTLDFKLVAAMGPLFGIIISIFFSMILRERIILVFSVFHILLILPFFQDGKKIWIST